MSLITRFNDAILIREDLRPQDDLQAKKELDDMFDELCGKYRIKAEKIVFIEDSNYNSKISIGYIGEDVFVEPNMKKTSI